MKDMKKVNLGNFVEKDCTIKHKGRVFESGGAYRHGDKMVAYLSSDEKKVTDWHGNTISDRVKIMKRSNRLNAFGDPMLSLRFKMGDEVWSGMNYGGGGSYLRAKKTKRRFL